MAYLNAVTLNRARRARTDLVKIADDLVVFVNRTEQGVNLTLACPNEAASVEEFLAAFDTWAADTRKRIESVNIEGAA